ncbi:MAG: potassium transporter Kup, partial [Pelagibacterales bacterium]|nr:potassium transporter Kup [Pelagibacterales bacterium]
MIINKLNNGARNIKEKSLTLIVISTLGVVFGDIGTSPLYALKLSVEATKSVGAGFAVAVYGALSLITWALIVVVGIKYLIIIMRADNHGEGGVFALTALLQRKIGKGPIVMILGLIGASLFFGDALITPAISVISAVEGLKVLNPAFQNYIVIISLALISILFAVERFGTSKIGAVFGPIMLVWFLTIGALGLMELIQKPIVLKSLNPKYAYKFLSENIGISVLILGAVVLAITGAEALYSDMGHYGKKPIRISWFSVVFPCLLLNYYGQGALLLSDPKTIDNPFFRLAPDWGLIPLIILATIATIIASQAVISGVFSITSQAVQLGYIPRLRVRHTSDEFGEVYLSKINIALFIGVAFLIITFKSTENLAGAYGISVTGAMLVDTILATYLLI